MTGKTLVHPDGRTVTLLDSGTDDQGDYLLVQHTIVKQGPMNGPHWHPVLQETFTVQEGLMRFVINGEETIVEQGGQARILPTQIHQFWNVSTDRLVALHEIRPPGQHWNMFELIHKLECEGKLNNKGIPSNPLWLGAAWRVMDGYLAGPPRILQTAVLGGLARLADLLKYRV